jgi:hypothetical protein
LDRSSWWYLVGAVSVSVVVLAVLTGTAYFAFRADEVLGHGPLPSAASDGRAYAVTLLMALLGIVAGGVTHIGLVQTRGLTGRFYWVVFVLVVGVLLLVLLLPLRRFGLDPWASVPVFLVVVPAQIIAAVVLGFVVFSRLGPSLTPGRWRGQAKGGTAASRPTTAIRGLPGRFTPSAWRVLSHMQEEAKRFEHGFMGTEHMLLGMVRERQALAARALVNLGVDVDAVRSQVEGIIGRRGALVTGAGGLTRRCRRVIEQSARLARDSGRRTVGTGHLLQSLMTDPEDASGQMLESMGVTESRVAEEMRHLGYETEETEQIGAAS